MRKGINSRKKGSKNEREVAHLLEQWTGREFSRTPGSGGLRWGRRTDVIGDVVCTTEGHIFPFSVETKFYNEINFEHLVSAPLRVKLLDFWAQATRDAERAKKVPLLLVRYNRMNKSQYYAFIPKKVYWALTEEYDLNSPALDYITASPQNQFIIMQAKTLFQLEYLVVKRIAKKYLKSLYNE